ncbi:uncharacterized protein Tco_0595406 [Tanacetum coccineum]
MVQESYVEGCSMQRPPLLEPNGFCFWKARFETYVKSKDIDLVLHFSPSPEFVPRFGEGDINSFLNKFTDTIKNMEKKISGSTRQVTFESVPLSETPQVNSDVGNGSIDKRIKPISYASLLNSGKTSKKANFRSLYNTKKVEGADLVIPMANVQQYPGMGNDARCFDCRFFEDGLSMIATKLGRPIMLDAYTSTMCMKSWGRTSYARALVEITSDQELKESIVVAIPRLNGKGHTMEKIRVKFEWKPPRCDVCKIFGHVNEQCSKNIKSTRINDEDQECFIIVGRKRGKGNMHNRPSSRQIDGARLNKPKPNFQYRPVNKTKKNENKPFSLEKVNLVELKNSYDALRTEDNEFDSVEPPDMKTSAASSSHDVNNVDSDEDEVENVFDETSTFIEPTVSYNINDPIGTSTPVDGVSNSHIASSRLDNLCSRVFWNWDWTSNGNLCTKGSRIILGWNLDEVDIMVIAQSDQVMHTQVRFKADQKILFCSFIYAHNRYTHKRDLWQNLMTHKSFIHGKPWCLLGDFNYALNLEDHASGTLVIDISMREFKECVEGIEVLDVSKSGLHFTWNQKPKGGHGVLKKINRIMANLEFHDVFAGANALFQPYRISDHSPAILKIPKQSKFRPKPFKFSNLLVLNENFSKVVNDLWDMEVDGFNMFCMVKKLKALKNPFRNLLKEKGNLHDKVKCLRVELDEIINQRAKVEWLRVGDSNMAYFHKAVKSQKSRSRIDRVIDMHGVCYEGSNVHEAFVTHFSTVLGQNGLTTYLNDQDLFGNKLNSNQAEHMVRDVSNDEIKAAIFSMGDDKSLGPDGYTSAFFKEAWDIVSFDVSNVARKFFISGKLLKEVNHTIIDLIPNVSTPTNVNDYRPISCFNVFFKCISKIISNHIKDSLTDLVSINQSAFVPGRRISNNILLTQELRHNYHLDRGPLRCAFKLDIQKAYNTVDWKFLKKILIGFIFHSRMVSCIMECVTSTSFSVSINGSLYGFFKGKRGLHQGDPLSPYLFTLVMEILTLTLKRKALDDFKSVSGLIPSLPKSTAYFCNVLNHTKLAILSVPPFEVGSLLVKYLGVPLVSSRLIYRDCKELVERVQNRVGDRKNNFFLFAGRLQLVKSVISSMHVYWSSVFLLRARIMLDIEQFMRSFLWCHGVMRRGKAKVASEDICLPKYEGGLGIRQLEPFNVALHTTHVWSIITLKESLWVK